ncbi:MAG: hypothetical protein IPK72_09430 [Candidatus Eisenbacteria bacterium]|nr:hypothetical protein [Candidatus Eisenbacteria bacterium]
MSRRFLPGRGAVLLLTLVAATAVSPALPSDRTAPVEREDEAASLTWTRLVEHAPFPASYNFPVHVAPDGRFVALHPEGTWSSQDGVAWEKTLLPFSGMNSAYLSYVNHDGATWALGALEGDYRSFRVSPTILRTRDYLRWEVVGVASSLPQRIFYAAAGFSGAIWILGGHDGERETSEVWRSVDGVVWNCVLAVAPWSPRAGAKAVVFQDRLYLIGGGRIDGPSTNDVWSSGDGIAWIRETAAIAPEEPVGYTPVVHLDQIWLVGANRSGRFRSEMLVSSDGRSWRAQAAPWSPRGGVAAWSDGHSLYLTGGKFSTVEAGETVFAYCNDVWRLGR